MNYTLLIYETQADFAARTDPARKQAFWNGWRSYADALRQAGVFVGGAGLQPPEIATTVRLRDGQRLVQDGPYAEAKEQLGGYFILELPDLDAALDWAARCPALPSGTVEVRPNLPAMG